MTNDKAKGFSLKWNKSHGVNKPKRKKINKGQLIFYICMMTIPIIFGVFYDVYLKLSTFNFMFKAEDQTSFGFFYINWAFEELLTSGSDMQRALKFFFQIFLIYNFICMPTQVIMSYFFTKKIPGTMFFRILFYTPTLISGVVTTLVFGLMMDGDFGVVPPLLEKLGMSIPLEGLMYSSKTAFTSLMGYEIWISFGVSTLIYTAAINKIPQDLFEVGRLDGAGMLHELLYIVFPMISPILSVGFLQNTTTGFNIYTELLLLTDPTQSGLTTVSYMINEGAKARKYCNSAAIGFVFTLIAIPVISGMRKAFDKLLPDVSV